MKLPRYTRPAMRPIGRTAQRKAPVRRQSYAVVSRRARGRCELCGVEWERLTGNRLSVHHVYGRRDRYSDEPELLLGVCNNWPLTGHLGCHERIHAGDVKLEHKARWLALTRFTERWELELRELFTEAGPDLVAVMRACCRRLEERTGA